MQTCQTCGTTGADVETMLDPFTTALYPEDDDHEQMTLCPLCARDRYEDS
ncbi:MULTISPECIES: hypothetical protein [Streptomyces]|uniref:Uncharacterized protein n=1 Tax=Streptomyces fungicidicus TaxID=68203 RepID=A0ACC7Y1Z8_9ACTN|nr:MULTISPECIES: hypothetical protein [Streptomyces]NUV75653.1 hypothetical protein [Streptomyces fungicidicus]